MRAAEFREKSDEELRLLADEIEKEMFNLRFQRAVDRLENPMRMRNVRRDLARIKSILREREIATEREKRGQ